MAWIRRHYELAWGLGALAFMLLVVLAGALLSWGLKEVYGERLAFDPWEAWPWWGLSFGLVAAGWLMLVFLDRLGEEEAQDDAAV